MMNPNTSFKSQQQPQGSADDILKLFGSSAPFTSSSGDDEFDAFMNGDNIGDLESDEIDHLDNLIPNLHNDVIVTVGSPTDFDW